MVQAEKHSAGWYFKRYLLMGFFALAVLVSLVVSDKSDVFATTQECDYRITETDQDFLFWLNDNISSFEDIKKYLYVRSMGDSWAIVSSDVPLKKINCGGTWYDYISAGTTCGSSIYKGSNGSYYKHTDFSYCTYESIKICSFFGSDLIWSNYDVTGGVGEVVDGKWVLSSADKVFF